MDISSIEFRKCIYHEILHLDTDRAVKDPIYEEDLLSLDDQTERLFRKRLVDALGRDSRCVALIEGKDSIVPKVQNLLNATNAKQFISISKEIAKRLADNQKTRVIPGGVLFIVAGVAGVDANPFVALMKSETQNGLAKQKLESGKTKLQYINDLLMTKEKKLYKVGMFTKVGEKFEILVYDESMNTKDTLQPTTYFYRDFLGCDVSPSNSAYTLEFYLHSKDLIQKSSWTDQRKVEVTDSLYCYLKLDKYNTASVKEFADTYLDGEDEADYFIDGFEGKPCAENAFTKDLTHLKNKLRRRNMEFQHGIKIVGSPEDLKDYVTIQKSEENSTLVEIKGKLISQ